MRYTLFLYQDEALAASTPPAVRQETYAAFMAYTQSLKDAGVFVAADWLKPSASATMLSVQDGARRIQDGPYAASKEQLSGFYHIDVPGLDEALAWAEKCPAAAMGKIEVRPSMS